MTQPVKYLVLSDIHLGHRVNKSENIYMNIIQFFKTHHEVIKDIHFLFLAGDVFDRFLASYSDDYLTATHALTFIITWCQQHHVKLRILEGTPSHDWGQARVISSIVKELNVDINYRYINDLTIEQDPDTQLSILYIPDEYKHKASDTLKEVKTLLKSLKLSKVDIAIMHGQFHYQLPMVKLESSHDEQEYLSLVNRFISIGHIHTHSSFERIIAQGSFDRLAHGEEEDKGGVIISLNTDPKNDQWFFLRNKRAMSFLTFDLTKDMNVEKELLKIIKTTPKGSALRFIVNDKDKFISKLQEFKKISQDYNIKVIVPDVKSLKQGDDILSHEQIKTFSITKDNILDLVKNELILSNTQEQDIPEILECLRKIM